MSRPVKGLIIKDLRLIFSQMKFFLLIIVVWAIFMIINLKEAFFAGYIALMLSFITLSTFNYDEAEKGMSYLFTLPIRRKDYIKEKYLLGLIIIIIPALIITLLTCIPYIAANAEREFWDVLFFSLITIPAAIVLLVLEIPLYIKFGQEKRRIVTVISIGVMAACFGMFGSLFEMADRDNIVYFYNTNAGLFILLLILFVTILTMISYKMSCIFMERKQF